MNKNTSTVFLNVVSWQTVEIIPFRRTGRWIVGAAVQESDDGKRRLKIFKGRIRDDGRHEIIYKGQRIRFNMSQRLNIPSLRYWEWLRAEIDVVARKYIAKREEGEQRDEPRITDFI